MTARGRGRRVGPRRSCEARGTRRGEGDTPWSQSPEVSAPPPPPSCTPRLFRAPQPPEQRRGRAAVVEALRSRRGPAGARRGSPPGDAAASPVAVPLRARPKQLREEEAAALGARAPRSGGRTANPHAPVRSPRGQAGSAGRPLGSSRTRRFGCWGAWCAEVGSNDLQPHPVSPSPSGRDGLREWVTASDTAPWSWCRQSCAERGGKGSRSLFLISVNDCGDGVVRGRPEECVCVRDRRRGWGREGGDRETLP